MCEETKNAVSAVLILLACSEERGENVEQFLSHNIIIA